LKIVNNWQLENAVKRTLQGFLGTSFIFLFIFSFSNLTWLYRVATSKFVDILVEYAFCGEENHSIIDINVWTKVAEYLHVETVYRHGN
jgi:hypothetical protein